MTDDSPRNLENDGQITRQNNAAQLVDRGDLTALKFDDLLVDGATAQQALFSGTLFRASTFRGCNFRRSDFEGAVFESSLFEDCDFSVADFRSVDVARCRFVRCKFNEGSTRSSDFAECSFEQCEFKLQNFEQNRVRNSRLNECRFERSTILHCHFSQVDFADTDLADCTAQFHIFDNCTFKASKLNAEAIGLTFGLTLENLSSIELLWRGNGLEKPGSDQELIYDLMTTYRARGWEFAAAIINLNFRSIGRVTALNDVFAVLAASLESSRPVLDDEVTFFSHIVKWLSDHGRLPFVGIVRGLDLCVIAAERSSRNEKLLRPLYYTLKDAEYLELNNLDEISSMLPSGPAPLIAEFVFEEQPSISFRDWVEELATLGVLSAPAPEFRGAKAGSYIEIFYATAGTLASLLVCLGLVERIIDRLIYIRARSGVLASAKLPPAIRRRALQPIAAPSRALSSELRTYLGYLSGPHASRLTDDAEVFSKQLKLIEVSAEDAYPRAK